MKPFNITQLLIYTLLAIVILVIGITELWHFDFPEPTVGQRYSEPNTNVLKKMINIDDYK